MHRVSKHGQLGSRIILQVKRHILVTAYQGGAVRIDLEHVDGTVTSVIAPCDGYHAELQGMPCAGIAAILGIDHKLDGTHRSMADYKLSICIRDSCPRASNNRTKNVRHRMVGIIQHQTQHPSVGGGSRDKAGCLIDCGRVGHAVRSGYYHIVIRSFVRPQRQRHLSPTVAVRAVCHGGCSADIAPSFGDLKRNRGTLNRITADIGHLRAPGCRQWFTNGTHLRLRNQWRNLEWSVDCGAFDEVNRAFHTRGRNRNLVVSIAISGTQCEKHPALPFIVRDNRHRSAAISGGADGAISTRYGECNRLVGLRGAI